MRDWLKCVCSMWPSMVYAFYFIFIKCIGVTLVNKIIYVSSTQSYNTSPVYCMVCSTPKVKSQYKHFHVFVKAWNRTNIFFLVMNLWMFLTAPLNSILSILLLEKLRPTDHPGPSHSSAWAPMTWQDDHHTEETLQIHPPSINRHGIWIQWRFKCIPADPPPMPDNPPGDRARP